LEVVGYWDLNVRMEGMARKIKKISSDILKLQIQK
jgi:hypothetical protein